MKRALPLALILAAAACSEPAAPTNEANAAAEEVIVETEAGNAATAQPPVAETPGAQPEAAPIPARFRGIWAESHAVCAQLSHPSRLIISGRTLRYPSFVLEVDSVDFPTDASFAVKGRNKRTGTPAEAHFSIDATGNILTDEAGGGAVRMNCP